MKLKFFATYRDVTHCKETDVPAPCDVWALLTLLGERYGAPIRGMLFTPDGTEIGENAIILIGGRNIQHLSGKDTPLNDTDIVSIFPMVAGG
jgi:MoaD family protein